MTIDTRDADGEIAAVIQYCARFDPLFAAAVVGASDADLARLQALAKLPLPEEYAAFHRRMGRTPFGALGRFMSGIEFGVVEVARYYEKTSGPFPDNALYLWNVEQQFEAFLANRTVDGLRPVIGLSWPFDEETGETIPGEPASTFVSRSLLQFLYRQSFLEVRLPALAFHAQLSENIHGEKPHQQMSDERRAAYRELAKKLGFQPVPHMTDDLSFFDRDDAGAALLGEEYAPDSLYLAAGSQTELRRLIELFSENLDFRRWS